MPLYIQPPPGNPLSRVLTALAAGALLALAFFFGLVVLALAVGLMLLAWLALAVRGWWLRGRSPVPPGDGNAQDGGAGGGGQVLEGDYEVVSRHDDDEERR